MIRLFVILCCYFLLFVSFAQTNTWTGAADTDWHKACNWSLGIVPTCSHNAVIPDVANDPDITNIAHCNTITIQGNAVVDISSSGSGRIDIGQAGGCSGTAHSVSAPTITGTTPASRCGTGTVTLGATASGGTINWYAASTGGSSLGTGTSFTTPSISSTTTYYVDATSGCTTPSRTAVVATIDTDPGTANNTTDNSIICTSGTKTLTGTPAGGTWSIVSGGGSISGTTYTASTTIGAVTIRYTIAANGSCPGSTSDVTFNVSVPPFCGGGGGVTTACGFSCDYRGACGGCCDVCHPFTNNTAGTVTMTFPFSGGYIVGGSIPAGATRMVCKDHSSSPFCLAAQQFGSISWNSTDGSSGIIPVIWD